MWPTHLVWKSVCSWDLHLKPSGGLTQESPEYFQRCIYIRNTREHKSTPPINLHLSFLVFLLPFPPGPNNGYSVLCKHSYLIRCGAYPRMPISDPWTSPSPFPFIRQWGGRRLKNKHLNVAEVSAIIYEVNVAFYSPVRGPSVLISRTLLT